MEIQSSAYEEVLEIFEYLDVHLPRKMDGKTAILEMKEGGSRNWRQMEWIGFWFEHFVESRVIPSLGGGKGPTYGTTEFDFRKKFVWDLKAHPMSVPNLILNDQLAIKECVKKENGVGFIIVSGETSYDDSKGSFKTWHDNLKGGVSAYEIERRKRGAPSRRRKTSFEPKKLDAIWFHDLNSINSAVNSGWLEPFQENMRNSNGKPRPAKFQFSLSSVPTRYLIAYRNLH